MAFGNVNIISTNLGPKLRLTISDAFELDQSANFVLEGDKTVNHDVALALGYNSLTINSGSYSVDYSNFQHGVVDLNFQAN